ncbi:hypothetical protein DL93DRAFT_403421 [Clavulina sp. PMI_390]|nr:hypothetical protein DL93DRAFT_403421 [Clavulina sp. PMI_390]
MCARLNIQCLAGRDDRYEWMRDDNRLKALTDEIKKWTSKRANYESSNRPPPLSLEHHMVEDSEYEEDQNRLQGRIIAPPSGYIDPRFSVGRTPPPPPSGYPSTSAGPVSHPIATHIPNERGSVGAGTSGRPSPAQPLPFIDPIGYSVPVSPPDYYQTSSQYPPSLQPYQQNLYPSVPSQYPSLPVTTSNHYEPSQSTIIGQLPQQALSSARVNVGLPANPPNNPIPQHPYYYNQNWPPTPSWPSAQSPPPKNEPDTEPYD